MLARRRIDFYLVPGGGIIELNIKIKIPPFLERILIAPVLLYRFLRFGYTFRKIPLTQGKVAIVDPADYAHLTKFKWRTCKTKGKNTLYAERSIRKPNGRYSRFLMHRQVLSLPVVSLPAALFGGLVEPPVVSSVEPSNGQVMQDKLSSSAHSPRGPGAERRAPLFFKDKLASSTHPPRAPWAEQRAPSLFIDHVNRNGLDNRRANLRLATHSQNAANSRPRKSRAGLKGVTFCKDKNLWRANICVNGKRIHLGYFKNPRQAALAYDNSAKKHFRQFARLNFSQNI